MLKGRVGARRENLSVNGGKIGTVVSEEERYAGEKNLLVEVRKPLGVGEFLVLQVKDSGRDGLWCWKAKPSISREKKKPLGAGKVSVAEGKKESWCWKNKASPGRRRNPGC